MTDSTLTHLALVLDRSGSMAQAGKAAEAEKGVRALLDEQIAIPGRLEVSIARFDDVDELLCVAQTGEQIEDEWLRIDPRGMTALFDAVGDTIVAIGKILAERTEADRPGRVVVLVATDGLENASRCYTAERLRKLIEQQTNTYGWEFMFMGTSQDAVLQAVNAGFGSRTSYAATDSAKGVRSSYAAAGASLTRARVTGMSVEVTDEDRAGLE